VCNSYHCPFKHRYFTLLQRYTHLQESIKFENLNPEGQRKDPLHKKKNPKILSVSWFCSAMLLLPLLIRMAANPEGQRRAQTEKNETVENAHSV